MTPKRILKLTPKQQCTLEIIAKYWNENGFAPALADIRDELKLSRNSNGTVIFRINSLEKNGLIIRNKGIARSIKLTELGKKYLSNSEGKILKTSSTDLDSNFKTDESKAKILNYTMKGRI